MGSFFLIIMFALQYMFIQIGSQTWASLSFVPPGWGANSSQSCRSCAFSGHKQRCWTVLSELRYKVAHNPNTFFLNWKQRSAEKAVEDALQYNKMYVAGVWTKTAERYSYFKKDCRKNVYATSPKGNMGYDQYTVPSDDRSCRTYFCCFPLALANTFSWPFVPILSNFFRKKRTQNHPQCLSGLSRALFPTTFLEIAVF